MVVDLNYGAKVNKKFIQDWWKDRGKDDPSSAVGIMACATGVQCINVAYWIAEIEGWPEFLKKSVDSLVKFYGYTEIINKPEGCPW